MAARRRPDRPSQPELDFRGATSKARKRRKQLKRHVGRAERIRTEGLGVRDVPCPHCGAPPFLSVRRGLDYQCRTPGGLRTHGRTLPSGEYHRRRHEEAELTRREILDRGEEARRELQSTEIGEVR